MLAKYDCHLKNMASSSFLPENGNSVAVMLFLMTFCPCCTADLLDSSLFSQTLTKLASDGPGQPGRLQKTISMQSKRRVYITRDYIVRQTKKLAFIISK